MSNWTWTTWGSGGCSNGTFSAGTWGISTWGSSGGGGGSSRQATTPVFYQPNQVFVAPPNEWQWSRTISTTNTTPPQEEQSEMQLYEYAVSYIPQDDDGNVIKADARILIQPSTKLAANEEQVRRAAILAVGSTLGSDGLDFDFVVVQVRPFGGR